jgi:hypothetical protein
MSDKDTTVTGGPDTQQARAAAIFWSLKNIPQVPFQRRQLLTLKWVVRSMIGFERLQ